MAQEFLGAGWSYPLQFDARGRLVMAREEDAVRRSLWLVLATALGERVMPHDWSPLILLALTSQIVGQGLMTWSLPRFSPLVIGLTLLVQPAIAAFAGWIVFDELLGPVDIFGGMLVGAALVLIRLPSRTARPI